MNVLVVSSSLNADSRSRRLARLAEASLRRQGVVPRVADLREHRLPGFDDADVYGSGAYRHLHALADAAGAIVLCSPVYNWGLSAELKRFVEVVGSTPPGGSVRGAFFDKVVAFAVAGGLPHGYAAHREMATALMLDFKCVVNPYHVYAHNRSWDGDRLTDDKAAWLDKAMLVTAELCRLLAGRTYASGWEV